MQVSYSVEQPLGDATRRWLGTDGRWAAAYDSSANATVPPEFVKELARNAKAKQFYATLNKANLYSIAYRLQTAKRPETKIKRIKLIIEMLARGEKFH
jgi:uncharacterized protein YdeI (YjbR/CyaY-like superfamily)